MSGPRLPNNQPFINMGGQHRQVPVPSTHPMPQLIDRMSGGVPIGMPPSILSLSSTSSPTMCSPSPFNATPRGFQPTEPIKISDISNERMTERDAKEQLSSYVGIRLEKIDNLNDVDEFGHPRRSAWEKVRQIIETGSTKQEAARHIHFLERTTKSVREKKAGLSPVIQRQLERAREMLQENEPDQRYHYILVQFESHLKEMKPNQVIYMTKEERERKQSKSSKKEKSKPQYDRVSITAYFKRVPKPNQNAKRMLEEKDRRPQIGHQQMFPLSPSVQTSLQSPTPLMSPMPPIATPAVPPPRGIQPHQSIPVRPLGIVAPKQIVEDGRANETVQGKGDDGEGFSKHGVQIIQHDRDQSLQDHDKVDGRTHVQEKSNVQIMPAGKRPPQIYHSSTQSSDSRRSSGSSWSSSHDDAMTAESSVGSSSQSSKISRGRTTERPQQRDTAQFGRPGLLREHSRERTSDGRDGYPPRDLRPSVRHVPANLGIPKVGLERRAYNLGRSDFQAPRPRVIQIQSGIRRVSPSEARQEILSDSVDRAGNRLERLRLGNDAPSERSVRWKDDAELGKFEDMRQRGALRARTQGARDDLSPVEHKTRWTELQAKEYMRNRQ